MYIFFLLIAGEPLLGVRVVLEFPYYDPKLGQIFPFRTVCMIVCIIVHCFVSFAFSFVFKNSYLPSRFDLLKVCCDDKNVPDLSVNHVPCPKLRTENGHVNSTAMGSEERVSQVWEFITLFFLKFHFPFFGEYSKPLNSSMAEEWFYQKKIMSKNMCKFHDITIYTHNGIFGHITGIAF